MTRFTTMLLGATAITTIAGMAVAQSNSADSSQSGNDNTLLIQQGHSGSSTGDNIAGGPNNTITQNGNDNEIDIDQTHNGAHSGSNGVSVGGSQVGAGVDQIGNNNKLTIKQTGGDQKVFEVQQQGGGASPANSVDIDQTGRRQTVSNVSQDFNGANSAQGNSVLIDQSGKGSQVGNTSSGPRSGSGIVQTGNGNFASVTQEDGGSKSNHLHTLTQTGQGGGGLSNSFELKQSGGEGNRVSLATQINSGSAPNTVTIEQTGDENGRNLATGVALSVGLGNSSVFQDGAGNDLDYTASGTDNAFGFSQSGRDNDIDALSNGVGNELALLQNGNENVANAEQQGVDNEIGATMTGNRNQLNMLQVNGGTGDGNSISVAVNGNDNNNFPTSPGFSGDAEAARDVARAESGIFGGLVQGDLFQDGNGNSMNLTVNASANAFAMAQNGDDNSITGTIGSGSQNQAVVAQVSSGNSATFSISGVGNNTGIIQGN